jgi:hypothetical protein
MTLPDPERAAVDRIRADALAYQTMPSHDVRFLLGLLDRAYPPERETHPGKPHSRSATRQR